jgi:hypothetical protein
MYFVCWKNMDFMWVWNEWIKIVNIYTGIQFAFARGDEDNYVKNEIFGNYFYQTFGRITYLFGINSK